MSHVVLERHLDSHEFRLSGEINDVSKLLNFLKKMFQLYSCKDIHHPVWSNCYFSTGTYDISQLLSSLFLLNLLHSIMSAMYEVVFNLNATCCVMSAHCWHFYSGSLNATPTNRRWCSIFIHVSCHQFGSPSALSPTISSHSSSQSLLSVWNKRLWPFQIIKTSYEPFFMAHQTVQ